MQRGSLVGLLVLLVLAATTGGLAGSVTAQEESQAGTPTPDGATNETVRHVDPDGTNEDGDLGGLQSMLADRMAERLTGSSVQLSQGQYDLARQFVGEEYRDQYGKYVDVNGETERDGRTNEFERAQDRQQELANEVESYNETREEYRDAKQNGEEQRARQLARDLEQQAENVSETADRLNRSYGNITEETGVDLSVASESVRNVSETVTAQQTEVREAEFEPTSLTANVRSERASFVDPQVIDGRLTIENGSTLANRTVVIEVGERRETVETNATGAFTVEYRPVTTRTGPTNVTVRYVPDDESVYLGSRANVSAVVESVDSTVSFERLTPRAAFGTPVEVSGMVTAAERGVPGVPVVVSVAGNRIARGTTAEDGRFMLSGELPAGVPVGNQTVSVRVPLEERAITGSNATQTIDVTETATSLTLETETAASNVTLAGALTTRAGEGISGQQLEIRRNGSVVATAQTGPEGRYEATVSGSAGERYRVSVRYDEPSTNLANASVSAVVTLPGGGGDVGLVERVTGLLDNPLVALGGLIGLGVILGLGMWVVRETGTDERNDEGQRTVQETPAGGAPGGQQASTGDSDTLAAARSTVDESPDTAVEQAYSATRSRLQADGIASPDATHWEFYRACVAAGLEDSEALETLTLLYERAAFGPSSVPRSDAETALTEAALFV